MNKLNLNGAVGDCAGDLGQVAESPWLSSFCLGSLFISCHV